MAVLSSTMTVLVNSLLFMALALVQEMHGLILKPLKQNERTDTIAKQFDGKLLQVYIWQN